MCWKNDLPKIVFDSLGLIDGQITEDLPKIIADILAFDIHMSNDQFLEKTYVTQQKVRFIEDDRFDVEGYQGHISK